MAWCFPNPDDPEGSKVDSWVAKSGCGMVEIGSGSETRVELLVGVRGIVVRGSGTERK
jgi:hypothetical protein